MRRAGKGWDWCWKGKGRGGQGRGGTRRGQRERTAGAGSGLGGGGGGEEDSDWITAVGRDFIEGRGQGKESKGEQRQDSGILTIPIWNRAPGPLGGSP